jgi:hypothetical protein
MSFYYPTLEKKMSSSSSDPTPPAALPPPAAAHTSGLVVTPPSLKELKGQRKALAFICQQLREVPDVQNIMSCPMIEWIANLAINHLPASAPVEHVIETVLQVYQTLYREATIRHLCSTLRAI